MGVKEEENVGPFCLVGREEEEKESEEEEEEEKERQVGPMAHVV